MIRFASPLPNNYDQIVQIFTRVEEDEERTFPSWVPDRSIKPQLASIPEEVPPVTSFASGLPSTSSGLPEPSFASFTPSTVSGLIPDPTPITMSHDSILPPKPVTSHAPSVSVTPLVSPTPFVATPTVLPTLNEQQLVEANPTLQGVYMQQRGELLEKREAASSAASLKEIEKVVEASKQMDVEIPQEFIDMQKQQFDQQQAMLMAARASLKVEDEMKLGHEAQIGLPPPNAQPVKRVAIARTNLVPETKAHVDVERAMPQAVIRAIETLRLDELRKLCVQNQVSSKGNKPDLIHRLKQKNVYQITV